MPVETSTSQASDATHSAARNFSQSAGCSMEQVFTPISIMKGAISPTPGFRPPFASQNEVGFFGSRYENYPQPPSSGTEKLSYEEIMAARKEAYESEMLRRKTAYEQSMQDAKDFNSGETPEPEPVEPFETGAVGPTINELNPYFPVVFGDDGSAFITWNDYNVVVHEPTSDLNLKKNSRRPETHTVRTQALRGPLVLSGWGFDIADLPVPNLASRIPGRDYEFDPLMVNQRSYWKTGPVHLMWDDQRQVWAGGYQVLCGYLSNDAEDILDGGGKIEAPTDPLYPTTFKVKVLRRTSQGSGIIDARGEYSMLTANLGEKITCVNRDVNLEWYGYGEDPSKVFVVAIRINYEWVPLWISVESGSSVFIGTFEDEWSKGQTKEVTQIRPLRPQETKVDVVNLFANIGNSGTNTCAYAKIGQSYYLIAAECPE